jgi:hypothetical protein
MSRVGEFSHCTIKSIRAAAGAFAVIDVVSKRVRRTSALEFSVIGEKDFFNAIGAKPTLDRS